MVAQLGPATEVPNQDPLSEQQWLWPLALIMSHLILLLAMATLVLNELIGRFSWCHWTH